MTWRGWASAPDERERRSAGPSAADRPNPTKAPGRGESGPGAALSEVRMAQDQRQFGARPYRRNVSAADVAGFGPKPAGWEDQFGKRAVSADPTIDELKQRQSQRLESDPSGRVLDGIELAQEWARDLTAFEAAERRRYRIDDLVETLMNELPAEIWVPSTGEMLRSRYRNAEIQTIESNRQVDPTPIRSKLLTMLMALRGEAIDPLSPVGPVWNEALGDMVAAEINTAPLTDEENLILWFFFDHEMKEWARREVAVQESVQKERERRAGVVAGGAAGGALQLIGVASIPAIAAGLILAAPAIAAVGAEASAASAATSDAMVAAGLRIAPRAAAWAFANPQTAIAAAGVGLNVAHDIGAGEFSLLNLPFYAAEIWGARLGDRSARASLPPGGFDEDMPGGLAQAPRGSAAAPDQLIDGPRYNSATYSVTQTVTDLNTGAAYRAEKNILTGRATITNLSTGETVVVDPGAGGPALGPGKISANPPPYATRTPPVIGAPGETGDEPVLPSGSTLALKRGRAAPRYAMASSGVIDDATTKLLSDFDRRVSKTGLIERIRAERGADGGLIVEISGRVEPGGLVRNPARAGPDDVIAPSFNSQARSRLGALQRGLQRLHLWGPGFGDEASAGMFVGPRSVNQVWQNGRLAFSGGAKTYKGIEGFMRELGDMAKARGGALKLRATAEAWPDISPGGFNNRGGEPMLKSAMYEFHIVGADGEATTTVTVHLELPDPVTWSNPDNVAPVVTVSGVGL